MRYATPLVPVMMLSIGAVLTVGVDTQRALDLRMPLDQALPTSVAGMASEDLTIDAAELAVAGVDAYLLRSFIPADSTVPPATLYVGYYRAQTQGRTIHSPKNCLPGAGWEVLEGRRVAVPTNSGPVMVNRHLIKKGVQTALVLYWYQGRGRIEANEYVVKVNLLRDAALRQRSDEALVRIVVPVRGSETEAQELAESIARETVPALTQALPR